eukprot:8375974-Pyramimonas_sp.AAC.1
MRESADCCLPAAMFWKVRKAKAARSTPRPEVTPYCVSPAVRVKATNMGVRSNVRYRLPRC